MKFKSGNARWCHINFYHRAGRLRSAVWCCLLSAIGFSVLSYSTLSFSQNANAESEESAWKLSTADEVEQADAELVSEFNVDIASDQPKSSSVIEDGAEELESVEEPQLAKKAQSIKEDQKSSFSNEQTVADSELIAEAEAKTVASGEPEQVITETAVSATPRIDISPELRQSLERQFEQIRDIEEEEDSFSENLGEAYLGYGKLLAQAGRLDEAREMYAKSLHLAKINNGVYAIEQRPVLRAIFEMHEATADVDKMEASLRQIVWLEKKHPKQRDNYSYDMVVKLGNLYIDQYISEPRITELTVSRIDKAIFFLRYAVNRYGNAPLSDRLMPYGELALLYFYKSRIVNELDRSFYDQSRTRSLSDLEKAPTGRSRRSFYASANKQLMTYLRKAEQEGSIEHQVRAMRDIGDLHLLFNRDQQANEYYNLSWLLAAQLDGDHELVQSFEQPNKLPDFNYAGDRRLMPDDRTVSIPLHMNLNRFGRVDKVHSRAEDSDNPKLLFRAKRASKGLLFRPEVENGRAIATDDFHHDVRVRLRKGEQVASADGV